MAQLPKMVAVEQLFPKCRTEDIEGTIQEQFALDMNDSKITPGIQVAIAIGSRGISHLQTVVKSVVTEIKKRGGVPFIVPAMGSHGGATAEGQVAVLESLGITEFKVGAPIMASMETVEVGRTEDGLPLYTDQYAWNADAIVLIARVKPHTDFKGSYESGLLKMLAIGLGKHKGAATLHSQGFAAFPTLIPHAGKKLLEVMPVALGVAVIENAYEDIARIQVIPAEQIYDAEPALLLEAKSHMPRLLVDSIDVLIIDEIGKDISGAGMDPNITGRFPNPITEQTTAPVIQKIFVRELSERTNGNATGIGMADLVTRRLVEKIDFKSTYTNCITSTVLAGAKIPLTTDTEQEAIDIAIRTCNRITPQGVKIIWIKNTLSLQHIYMSDTYIHESFPEQQMRIIGDPFSLEFDGEGRLITPFDRHED